jgi:hypothetical protein
MAEALSLPIDGIDGEGSIVLSLIFWRRFGTRGHLVYGDEDLMHVDIWMILGIHWNPKMS